MPRTPKVRLDDSDLERRRFLYVLSEALEKFVRLQEVLKRQQIFIKAENPKGGSASAVNTLIDSLDEQCAVFLGRHTARVSSLLRGRPLNEVEEKGVISALEILISCTLQVHELLLLLPRETAQPQTSFLLRDCLAGTPEDLRRSYEFLYRLRISVRTYPEESQRKSGRARVSDSGRECPLPSVCRQRQSSGLGRTGA